MEAIVLWIGWVTLTGMLFFAALFVWDAALRLAIMVAKRTFAMGVFIRFYVIREYRIRRNERRKYVAAHMGKSDAA